jgi:hypothetical protein
VHFHSAESAFGVALRAKMNMLAFKGLSRDLSLWVRIAWAAERSRALRHP